MPWINEYKNVIRYVMECYSAIKREEILPFAVMWMMNLEDFTVSEISQTKANTV